MKTKNKPTIQDIYYELLYNEESTRIIKRDNRKAKWKKFCSEFTFENILCVIIAIVFGGFAIFLVWAILGTSINYTINETFQHKSISRFEKIESQLNELIIYKQDSQLNIPRKYYYQAISNQIYLQPAN